VADTAVLETEDAAPVEERTADEEAPPSRRWLDWAVPIALFLGTIGTRLPYINRPNAFVFDEIYYALDGADIVRRGVERGGVVHPPVGKWLIAAGIRIYGFTPIGWRSGALVCGGLVVVLVYLTARQIVRGYLLPSLAALLVMLDGISYTTGRVAMLDVFVALFTMIAVYCTIAAVRHADDARLVRRYRWGAAIALGLGLGTKWTMGYVLLVCLIGFLAVHVRAPAEAKQGRAVLGTLLMLTLVPAAVYVLCYVPWLIKAEQTGAGYVACVDQKNCDLSVWDRLVLFKDDQKRILDFHTKLKSENNSNADFAYYWINQSQPAVLFRKTCVTQLQQAPSGLSDHACDDASPNDVMEIATVANPVVWYAGLAAGLVLIVKVIRRGNIFALLLLLFFFYQWFPWLLDPFAIKDAILHNQWHDVLQQRRAYSFYLSGMTPVLALFPAIALDHKKVRWLGWVLAATTVAAFAYYLPIWSGHPMSKDQIKAREYWTFGG
jgi:4-amino-4-deoxy-L-arabinose transferase-like glycosyltransferase